MKVLLLTGAAMMIAVVLFDILSTPVPSPYVGFYNYAPAPLTDHPPSSGPVPVAGSMAGSIDSAPIAVTVPAPAAAPRDGRAD